MVFESCCHGHAPSSVHVGEFPPYGRSSHRAFTEEPVECGKVAVPGHAHTMHIFWEEQAER